MNEQHDIESRLAEAMAARAGEVEPHDEDDALNRIAERVNMNRRRALVVLGIAAALTVVVGAVALLNRDDGAQTVNVASDSTTTVTGNSPPASVIPSGPTPVWPFDSMNRTFATPDEAALSFAVDYLGMTHARVGKVFESEVEIFPNDRGNARTLVELADRKTKGWVVLGAKADQINVVTPQFNDPLTSTLTLSGTSVAFEAQVGVELRPFGSMTPVLRDFAMGGATDMQPFAKQIAIPSTDQPLVLILFEGDASGEQTYTKATVIPLDSAGAKQPIEFVGRTTSGDLMFFDIAGHAPRSATENDKASLETAATLPSGVSGSLATTRGRFGTIAFWDGTNIMSVNPDAKAVVKLVQPAAEPISLDADESGRYLLWADVNHDLWKWWGGDPVKVGSGFNSAAW